MSATADARTAFRRLHESGCFVMPNPWDAGSARYLEHLGFPAVATTSSGFAWSTARADGQTPLDEVLTHFATIVQAVDVPVNADFEHGYADEPEGVGANVEACVGTGVAGLSIEDSTGRADEPLYALPHAVERIAAARAAIDRSDASTVLTARAECFLVGLPDIRETTGRLVAYAEAGADCLYAPGLKTRDDIRAVIDAVTPRPVNVLVGATGLSVDELADLGVRRISVGGALARTAWAGLMQAAREISERGTFGAFDDAASGAELNDLFRDRPD